MKFLISTLFFTLFVTGNAHAAGSALRIICDGDAANAEVYIDGKFKGECPLDLQVPEGKLSLRVQKATDAEHDPRLFEQEIRMGDGVMKKVEVKFGPIELNAAGKRQEAEKRAEAQRRQEEEARSALQSIETGMVTIPGKNYEMGKYEVTQKEWRAVMGSDPPELNFKGCDDCPVEQVSWNDVHEFIQKLNQKTGKQYRLPIESEWEYACYGGSKTEYCGGGDIDAVAWYDGNSGNKTHPVGQKQANGYGLYDMSGNVWEWMENEYNGVRALRGGSWNYRPEYVRAAYRSHYALSNRDYNYGFRLARTLP